MPKPVNPVAMCVRDEGIMCDALAEMAQVHGMGRVGRGLWTLTLITKVARQDVKWRAVAYLPSAAMQKGLMLNYCPFCGVRIREDATTPGFPLLED